MQECWSDLKTKIELLFDERIGLRLECTLHGSLLTPRVRLILMKKAVFDSLTATVCIDGVGQGPTQDAQASEAVNWSTFDKSLDSQKTFENFFVNQSYQFAHASAAFVADNPGRYYNPLLIYGPPEWGKTHLLHAIGNHYLKKCPENRVACMSGQDFCKELTEASEHGLIDQFRKKYRKSIDLLLLDDIDFIAGKKSAEDEFFHIFNYLHRTKRQIVATAGWPLREIEGLDRRLCTRFEWGLIADVGSSEVEPCASRLKTLGVPFTEPENSIFMRLIAQYIDTPADEVLDKVFEKDEFGFTDLLKAADRRLEVVRLAQKFEQRPSQSGVALTLGERFKCRLDSL